MSETTNTYLINKCHLLHIPIQQVASKNQLKTFKVGYGSIINMADSNEEGSHWVAVYPIDRRNIYYFDSFGIIFPSIIPKLTKKYFKNGEGDIIYNLKEIQHITSGFCGEYCILFLYYCNKKGSIIKNINDFNNIWNDDNTKNKRILLAKLHDIGFFN